MVSFETDYNYGAHPKILERLMQTNLDPQPGYGTDAYCASAREKIRCACGAPNADVFFMVGGTQTNAVVIDSLLRSFEGVITADTGHVATHEAGAIEFTGHKVLTLPHHNGKLLAKELRAYLEVWRFDGCKVHMVKPGMVYLTYPTELGTLYTKAELAAIYEVCRDHKLPLYIDGARLGYGLMSYESDLTLPELAALCDVFYIGGTKLGALCGEAVVFPKGDMPAGFATFAKQHGALLAKGRLLGVQFDTLFTDDLYFTLGRNAIDRAEELKVILHRKNCHLWLETPTNQQFVILRDDEVERLSQHVAFSFWEKPDREHTVVRFVTNWGTTREQVEQLRPVL